MDVTVTGTIPILGFRDSILFDSEATHSFMSSTFAKLCKRVVVRLEVSLLVATPMGGTIFWREDSFDKLGWVCHAQIQCHLGYRLVGQAPR